MDSPVTPARQVYVCLNKDCLRRGNESIYAELQQRCAELPRTEIKEYTCFGNCDHGANVIVYPDKTWISKLRKDQSTVVLDYLRHGKTDEAHFGQVDEHLAETIYEMLELEVSSPQAAPKPTAVESAETTATAGRADSVTPGVAPAERTPARSRRYKPSLLVTGTGSRESIEEYEARGGYQALERVVRTNDPQQVISTLTSSGLSGKGGANFPAGKKWRLVYTAAEKKRYVVGNGGEHEPGSLKDRTLLERYPHSVLEGLLIAAYIVGALRGGGPVWACRDRAGRRS